MISTLSCGQGERWYHTITRTSSSAPSSSVIKHSRIRLMHNFANREALRRSQLELQQHERQTGSCGRCSLSIAREKVASSRRCCPWCACPRDDLTSHGGGGTHTSCTLSISKSVNVRACARSLHRRRCAATRPSHLLASVCEQWAELPWPVASGCCEMTSALAELDRYRIACSLVACPCELWALSSPGVSVVVGLCSGRDKHPQHGRAQPRRVALRCNDGCVRMPIALH